MGNPSKGKPGEEANSLAQRQGQRARQNNERKNKGVFSSVRFES